MTTRCVSSLRMLSYISACVTLSFSRSLESSMASAFKPSVAARCRSVRLWSLFVSLIAASPPPGPPEPPEPAPLIGPPPEEVAAAAATPRAEAANAPPPACREEADVPAARRRGDVALPANAIAPDEDDVPKLEGPVLLLLTPSTLRLTSSFLTNDGLKVHCRNSSSSLARFSASCISIFSFFFISASCSRSKCVRRSFVRYNRRRCLIMSACSMARICSSRSWACSTCSFMLRNLSCLAKASSYKSKCRRSFGRFELSCLTGGVDPVRVPTFWLWPWPPCCLVGDFDGEAGCTAHGCGCCGCWGWVPPPDDGALLLRGALAASEPAMPGS
mmetsp:Transcript_103817/g.260396  ORF Transcript_103817/g.260396 Transcript_103817/m.260396 type:complete len:331 (+) Transcript_103817:654-1646(+)